MSAPRVPLNDLSRLAAQVAPVLSAQAAEVLAGGRYVLGPRVAAFESAFADFLGAPHCVGVANGSDALEIALRAVGVVQGDHVVACANAAGYATGATLALGAVPVLADVDDRGLLSADTVARALEETGVRPRALLVTHLYGRMADMAELRALADRHQLRLVEDCAQAHGARQDGRYAGTWGDAAAFSFYPTKNLGAAGDGGAIVTAHAGIAARARQLRQYGWDAKYRNALPGGRNSRLDELQAAFLHALLPGLDARNARRRSIAARYSREIRHPEIRLPEAGGDDYVAHLYVVHSQAREALSAHLDSRGVASEVHYPVPDHEQAAFAGRVVHADLPATTRHCASALSLPCFPELRDDECDAVIAACNAWEAP